MAKTERLSKRLTDAQCKELFDVMIVNVKKAIIEALNYAAERKDYDPIEVKIFIRNHFEAVAFLSDIMVDKIAREQLKKEIVELQHEIDFPNSSSENNKSSKNNNESEVH